MRKILILGMCLPILGSCATTFTCTKVGNIPRVDLKVYTDQMWDSMGPDAKDTTIELGHAITDYMGRVEGRIKLHDEMCAQ